MMLLVWTLLAISSLSLLADTNQNLSSTAPAAEVKREELKEPTPTPPHIVSHRARYEIALKRGGALDKPTDGGLTQLTGHATIELRTVPGGYIRNVTFVMYAYSNEQPMQTIMRSFATFETENGQHYTFRVNTSNELGEEVSIKGEGLAYPQLMGIVKTNIDIEENLSDTENIDIDELNAMAAINVRSDLPPGSVFPMQFLIKIIAMINNPKQGGMTLTFYDPYWSSLYDVDLAIAPSKKTTQFNLIEGMSEENLKQLQGQTITSVACGFYPAGTKDNKTSSTTAEEPAHQMYLSLLPCGIITDMVMEDPAVGEPIKLTLSRVDLFN